MADETLRDTALLESRTVPLAEASAAAPPAAGFEVQSIGGVFDSAFELYRQSFSTIALIVAVVFIPTQVALHAAGNLWIRPISAQIVGDSPDPVALFSAVLLYLIIGAPQYGLPGYVSLLTSFMASGPAAVAVGNMVIGRPIGVGAAYKRAVPVFWRLFWTWTLFFTLYVLLFIMVMVALVLIILVLQAQGWTAVGGPEFGLAFVIGLAVLPYIASCLMGAALFAFAPPLIALENLSVLGAIERNSQLVTRQMYWRTCLSITLLPVLIFGLQTLMLLSASSVVAQLHWPAWSQFVINTGLSSLISFFFQPYWMIFVTLLYFDCRVRKEGIDVRYLADNLPELDPYLGQPADG